MVAFLRSAFNLAGHTDKLVFVPDISTINTEKNVAQICAEAVIKER